MEPGRFPFVVMKDQLKTPDVTIKEFILGFRNSEIPLGITIHCGVVFNFNYEVYI
jgi:hypothetical protein